MTTAAQHDRLKNDKQWICSTGNAGQPVAPDLPAADSLEPRCPFPANGRTETVKYWMSGY
jgi:hypothetical protein